MSFDTALQPILSDTGKLALSCIRVDVDASPVGIFSSAEFNLDGEVRGIKTGYPLRTTQLALDALSASAIVNFQEIGGAAKTLLSGIATSLNTGVLPTHDVLLEVFRPVAENITLSLTGAALKQEFTLNFGNDFNEMQLGFEQLVAAGTTLDAHVSFATLGQITYGATTPLVDKGDISMGLPQIKVSGVSLGAIQGAALKLTTSYRRVETGYPRTLLELTPLEHNLELVIDCEEFFEASLDEAITIGTAVPVTFTAALYDGTALVITLPEAILVPDGGPRLSQDNFATITKKFIATGATLMTVA